MKRMLQLVLSTILLSGCAASRTSSIDSERSGSPPQRVITAQRPLAASPTAGSPTEAAPSFTVIGHSVEGRPIELHRFGAGERPVLIIGAIHGNEPTSADVSRGLLEDLKRNPSLARGVPVAIVPVANPDGLLAGTRTNVNKVDLNRNFPAANWGATRPTTRSRNFGGSASSSEPETRALIATIERLNPRLIISVHSISAGRECNNYDGPAKHVADLMSRLNGYPSVPTIGYPTPGSMGSWAGIDRQIPMITLELPRILPAERAWPDNRSAVFAAIAAVRD